MKEEVRTELIRKKVSSIIRIVDTLGDFENEIKNLSESIAHATLELQRLRNELEFLGIKPEELENISSELLG